MYRNFYLNLQPTVYFLTGILKKSPELNVWIPDGIVIAAGLKMETVFKF
ncbi:MAG: hypothetical protein KF852_09055 [Saprospiraceae bacterium]|nr:hypothetical protein [Saprospiraceae bacterium]